MKLNRFTKPLTALAGLALVTSAQADFTLTMRNVTNGVGINDTSAAETLLSQPSSPGGGWEFTDITESPNPATIDVAGGGTYSPTNPLPNGNTSDDRYALTATANLVIPAGTWTIGFGSDDGGSIQIPGITFDSRFNNSGTFAANEVRWQTGRGHTWTGGTFTVAAPLTTTIYAMQYENTGGDSWEIGFAPGTETGHNNNWALLEDTVNGWTVQVAPINDTDPPVITSTDPVDDSTGAYSGGPLVATFDEEIALTGAGTITLTDVTDSTDDRTITLPDAGVTASGADLVIDLSALVASGSLEPSSDYEVTIDGSAIQDTWSTPNAYGGTAAGEWTFTTAAENLVAPIISTLSPLDDAPAVSPAAALVATFDQDVLINSGATQVLLDEDFEGDMGGFSALDNSGGAGVADIWDHGVPASTGLGGAVDGGAGGTGTECWGTNIGNTGVYTSDADTSLISPIINLTGLSYAELSFFEALDMIAGDTVVVNVIDDDISGGPVDIVAAIHTSTDGDTDNAPWAAANGGAPIVIPAAALGQEVRLEFQFLGSNTDGSYIGAYIDDVLVSGFDTANVITLKNLTDATETLIVADDASQVSVSGATVTVTPTIPMLGGKNYAVQIGATAIRNYSDVNFAGIADDTTWNFATVNVTTYAGATGAWNIDTWNDGANWDAGVPSGSLSAFIAAGEYASTRDTVTPAYTGDLRLEAGSKLEIGQTNEPTALNVLGGGTITMNSGTDLTLRYTVNSTHPNDFILAGDALIALGRSTSAHHETRTFTGAFSGTGELTIHQSHNNTLYLQGSSPTWSGGFVAGGAEDENKSSRIEAEAADALGTGDVTLNDGAGLVIDAADAIGDGATVSLSGGSGSASNKLVMNADDTIDQLFVEGVQYPAGTYSGSGTADFVGAAWIGGSSVLTVTTGPTEAVLPTVLSIDDNKPGGEIFDNGNVTYTVTFSEPMIASTVDVGDFGNAGTAASTVDSVTAIGLDVYEVVVSVSTTGTVQLQINSGAVLEDFATNELDTASAILDPDVIDVIPFVANSASLLADFQATIASEQHPDYPDEARYYHVSVNPANPGTGSFAATIVGTNNPAPIFVRNYDGAVLSYKFVGGSNNDISGVAASGGDASLITYTTEDTTFDGFGQGQAKIWDATDPGADLQTGGADPFNVTADKSGGGYRSFGGAVGTVDISGVPAGSLHIYYGSFNAKPSVSVRLVDSTGLHPDVTLPNVHLNDDSANRTEYYLAEVDFVTDGIYDVIEYTWLANGSDYTGNGRGVGTVLTAAPVTGSPYETWASGQTPPLTDDFDVDTDSDGVSNGAEWYYYDSDPNVAEAFGSALTGAVKSGADTFTFTHVRPIDRTGMSDPYMWSSALSSWNASGASEGPITVDIVAIGDGGTGGLYETVTVTATVSGGTLDELFIRQELSFP